MCAAEAGRARGAEVPCCAPLAKSDEDEGAAVSRFKIMARSSFAVGRLVPESASYEPPAYEPVAKLYCCADDGAP